MAQISENIFFIDFYIETVSPLTKKKNETKQSKVKYNRGFNQIK